MRSTRSSVKPAAQTPWFTDYEGSRREWFRKYGAAGLSPAELRSIDRRWSKIAALIDCPGGLRNTEYHN